MAMAARPRQQKEQLHKVYQHDADVERKKENKNCHQGAIVIACPFLEAAVRVLMLTGGQRLVITNRTRSQPPEWAWFHEWAWPAPFCQAP